jgi:anti-sigma B factor antagonist
MALTMASPSVHTAPSDRCTLAVAVRAEGAGTTVLLRGEADIASRWVIADVLSQVIAAAGGDVVVDVSRLEFIDSGGVRCLQVARRLLRRQGRNLNLRSPSRMAIRILLALGLSDLIEATA